MAAIGSSAEPVDELDSLFTDLSLSSCSIKPIQFVNASDLTRRASKGTDIAVEVVAFHLLHLRAVEPIQVYEGAAYRKYALFREVFLDDELVPLQFQEEYQRFLTKVYEAVQRTSGNNGVAFPSFSGVFGQLTVLDSSESEGKREIAVNYLFDRSLSFQEALNAIKDEYSFNQFGGTIHKYLKTKEINE